MALEETIGNVTPRLLVAGLPCLMLYGTGNLTMSSSVTGMWQRCSQRSYLILQRLRRCGTMTTNLTQKYGLLEQCGLTEANHRTHMGCIAHAIYHRPRFEPRVATIVVTQYPASVPHSPTVQSWQYPGRWTHVPSLQVTVGYGGEGDSWQ
jgi:hypothetical protein